VRAAGSFPLQIGGTPTAAAASLRDISEIGLACTTSAPIPEMTVVALDFALPGATERHRVQGAVVRCAPLGKAGKDWDVAVYFTEIAPVTRAALRHYVQKARKV
jgi:hypothetical protein